MGWNLPATDRILLVAQGLGGLALVASCLIWPAPGWPRLAAGLAAASLAIAGWAFVSLGTSFRIAPTPRPGARLVRTGIYRWFRHPMYVSVMLATAAAFLARPSAPVAIVAGLNAVLYLVKARYEERVLDGHYPEYAGYRRRTLGLPFARRQGSQRKP